MKEIPAVEVLGGMEGFPERLSGAIQHSEIADANYQEAKVVLAAAQALYAQWSEDNNAHTAKQAREGIAPRDFQPYETPTPQVEQLLDVKKAYQVEATSAKRDVGDAYGSAGMPKFLQKTWHAEGPGKTLDADNLTAAEFAGAEAMKLQVHAACTQMMVGYVIATGKTQAEVSTLRRLQSEAGTSKLINHSDVELQLYSHVREAADAKALAEAKSSQRVSNIENAALAAVSRRASKLTDQADEDKKVSASK